MDNINNNSNNNNLLPILTIKNNRFVEEVKKVVSSYYKITKEDIVTVSNKRKYVLPRQVAIYFCRKFLVYSTLEYIGNEFNKDHASVSHSIKQVNNISTYDKEFKAQLDELHQILFNIHNSIMLNNPINKNEYFIDLNNCTSIKLSQSKAIVCTGLSEDEIDELSLRLGLKTKTVQHKNTGMYIFIKDGE
jgi:hypothetical protein